MWATAANESGVLEANVFLYHAGIYGFIIHYTFIIYVSFFTFTKLSVI